MSTPTRSIWADQFNTPTVQTLRADLAATSTPLFDQLRTMLLGMDEIVESIRWFGDCWHWTIEYRLEDHHEDDAIGILMQFLEQERDHPTEVAGTAVACEFLATLQGARGVDNRQEMRRARRLLRDHGVAPPPEMSALAGSH